MTASSLGFSRIEQAFKFIDEGGQVQLVRSIGDFQTRRNLLEEVMDACQPVWPKVKDVAKDYFVRLAEVLLPELANNEILIEEIANLID